MMNNSTNKNNKNNFWSGKEVITIFSLFIIYSIIVILASFLLGELIGFDFSSSLLLMHIGCSLFIFILYAFFRKKNLSFLSFKFSLKWFLISILLIFIVILIDVFGAEFLNSFLINQNIDESSDILSSNFWVNIFNFYIFGSILIPFMEELIFRGLIFKFIRQSKGFIFSALTSSLMFSAIHINLETAILIFPFGIIVAFVFEKTNSIFYPFLIHTGANIILYSTFYV